MKNLMFLASFLVFAAACGQTKLEKKSIEATVKAFANAGDKQDVERLKSVTHDNYRLVWYGGKDAPFIADKTMFLGQFEKKEWGGDERDVKIESIQIFDEVNATAKVVSDGMKAQMRSFFTLIKVEGEWKIIGELVNATFK